MNRVYALLPCYNEEKDIAPLVEKWVDIKPDLLDKGYELSVFCINDCSTDNTKQVINELCKRFGDCVFLIDHEVNKGLGGVLMTAFRYFIENGNENDICILMDGDNTHDPIYCLNMFEKLENGKDCVIASRYCESSSTNGVSPIRLFMSWGAKQYYSLMLGVKGVKDYTCGYRGYTYGIIKKAFDEYGDNLVERRSFACMMEVLYKLNTVGARFDEVGFDLHYDAKEGESKMRILKTVRESLITAAKLRFSTNNKR